MMKAPAGFCCGSGVCIINDAGECWCGQIWDGEKMSAPKLIMKDSNSVEPPSVNDSTKAN
ncbi:hypothetical protein [Polynucleobacter brandtiae]|nr:hypothetical protein [Polynucleobacter brandtiae]